MIILETQEKPFVICITTHIMMNYGDSHGRWVAPAGMC